jgi:hypothetical protein
VKAAILAAALPLVTTTGNELISATAIEAGQTVLSPVRQEMSGVRRYSLRGNAERP